MEIRLETVPRVVDTLRISVKTSEQTFELVRARPEDDIVRDFSAIPQGPARICIGLLSGNESIGTIELEVDVVVDTTVEVAAIFDTSNVIDIVDPSGPTHRLYSGDIPITVRILNPDFSDVSAKANDLQVELRKAGNLYTAELDPRNVVGTVYPAQLRLVVEACSEVPVRDCREKSIELEVSRSRWTYGLGGAIAAARASITPDQSTATFGDDQGRVHVLDLETGDAVRMIEVGEPVSVPTVVTSTSVVTFDNAGGVHCHLLADGSECGWRVSLGGRPSTPVIDGERILVGAAGQLASIDIATGARSTVFDLGQNVEAAPFVDADDIIVAGRFGRVVRLDKSGNVRFDVDLAVPLFATPVQSGDLVFVATIDGTLLALDEMGDIATRSTLEGPVVHAPIVVEGQVVTAADSTVRFGARRVVPGGPITGAPQPWLSGLAVGLQNGRVVVVWPDGTWTDLHRTTGAALTATPIAGTRRLLVAGSSGDFHLLQAEEDFR